MRTTLLEDGLLRERGPAGLLRLETYRRDDQGHVLDGALWNQAGQWYPVERGVPCLLRGALRPAFEEFRVRHNLPAPAEGPAGEDASGQARTADTFSDKWNRFKRYGLEPGQQEFLLGWYCKKLGLSGRAELEAFYRGKQAILEVGPGSGFNSRFMAEHTRGPVVAVDISEAAYTTFENTRDLPNCHVVRADVNDLPLADDRFDFVIADGVLHHTPDTRQAMEALYRKVRPGGQFFFYVYRRMGPARQFCDRHIRQAFSQLPPDACYQACEGLTELGRELGRLKAQVTLTKPIPILGIPAGTHDVQRLLYYNFVKCFWNEAFDYDTNNMVNFDWYHPHHAWQHTQEEVRGWLEALGVREFAFHPANPNGISCLLTKPAGPGERGARAAAIP